jgi:hypothetical protein
MTSLAGIEKKKARGKNFAVPGQKIQGVLHAIAVQRCLGAFVLLGDLRPQQVRSRQAG